MDSTTSFVRVWPNGTSQLYGIRQRSNMPFSTRGSLLSDIKRNWKC